MRRKYVFLIAILFALIALLSSCGSSDVQPDNVDKTITDQHLDYSLYAHGLGVYDDQNDIVQKWEKAFNCTFHFEGAAIDWMETMCLRANSDDMPDLFFFVPNDTNYMEAYTNMISKGMITPVSDYVTKEETPNLYALLNVKNFENLKVNEKMYFVPSPNTSFNNSLYIRKDWLDKLGLKEPETIEEFQEVLRAFTEDDPDGNGKNDTYGLAASKVFDWMSYFKIGFGCEPGWSKNSDGNYELDAFTPEYREYLQWMSSLYEKGYLKNEFFLYEDTDAMNDFFNGKCGMILYNGGKTTGGVTFTIGKLDKNAVIDVIPMPSGKAEGGFFTSGDWWGGWSIAYSAKEPMRLVKFLEYLYSPEGMEERLYGLKDVHYRKEADGSIQPIFENRIATGLFGISEDGQPRDLFQIGAYFGSAYTIENNELVDHTSESIYREPELSLKSIEYAQKNLKRNFPLDTMHLGSEYASLYARVFDRIVTYSVRIISGSIGLDEGISKMRSLSEADGYTKLQEIIRDHYQ